MAVLLVVDDCNNGRIRRERVFRDHTDLLAHDDDWLFSRFRFPRAILLELCAELGPSLERGTRKSHALPVPLQVLTTLGFLASRSYQRKLADRSGITQSALSRIMPAVWDGIIRMSTRYIRFPYGAADLANIKTQFAAIAGFPNVIVVIDCTHIAIKAPSVDEFAYVNLKNFHSINVQIIWDAPMRFTNVVARWPGSTHESYILTNSLVGMGLQAGWLAYNHAHTITRAVIERAIEQLKCRWFCLDRSGGMLLYRSNKVVCIIIACATLHNLAHTHLQRSRSQQMSQSQHPPLCNPIRLPFGTTCH
ncbi:putative nuclease HARBI1 [Cololabis saira]|uniref:putative nuclease HARBI1 n=1 Tax=Cololabis saira TaxID=129043 RepID=UPI002AD34981|nr:putative nuclease HARBI1 [Cololabis saira]